MSNPFNTMKQVNNFNMQNIGNLYQTLMSSRNPIQLIENMAQNNPQLRPIVSALKGGANPKSLFESLCKEKGIDPNEFIKTIQGK